MRLRPNRFHDTTLRPTALLALLLLAWPATAQDDDEARRHGIFIDTLDVSLVNVEIVATRKGEPVSDLTLEDFEILDDGEPVEITNFYRVDAGRRVLPVSESDSEAEAGAEVEAAPLEKSFVVVLVDQAFLTPSSRARVFNELREKLDELMSDGTQVMVVSKQRSVELVQRPTTDRVEVEAALEKLGKVATVNYTTDVRRTIREIEQGVTADDIRALDGPLADTTAADGDALHTFNTVRSHSQQVFHEVRHSLAVLQGFMGSLSGLPGRKAVLYVCDRLPLKPGALVWYVWYEKYGFDYGVDFGVMSVDSALQEFDTMPMVRELVADAAANRIAFYPVGAGPVSGLNALSAENRSSAITAGTLTQVGDVESGLRMLADGTGGQAAIESGNPGWLLDRLRRDLNHYYSLAYASPHRGDGKTHRIRVRAKRPGIKLHYLEHYRDKSGDQQMSDRTMASLMLETSENPLGIQVMPGEYERQKDGHYLMEMQVRFPIANLVLLPQETAHVGRVSIVFLVKDAKGRLSEPVKVLVPIEVPHEAILESLTRTAVYATKLAIRKGQQTIAVGVHDDYGQESSTVNVDVQVGGSRG